MKPGVLVLVFAGVFSPSPAAAAPPLFDVRAEALPAADVLEVRLELTNRAPHPLESVAVEARLGGRTDLAALSRAVAPGETRPVLLRFPLHSLGEGVNVLALLIDAIPETGEIARRVSQAAAVRLDRGPGAPARLGISAAPALLAPAGALAVEVVSLDGRPHDVRLEVLAPRGLRALAALPVAVRAGAPGRREITLLRGDEPFGSEHDVVVVARTDDGDAALTAARVTVSADPAWLPALRIPLAASGFGLLAAALLFDRRPAAAVS